MSTVKTDTIVAVSTNGNLDLSGQGTGGVKVSDYLVLTKGADIASATALTLGKDGSAFDITGTTAITSIATQGIGSHVTLHFDGALTFTHHATDLILPGAANITTAAGDIAVMYEYASGDWRCVSYSKASGEAVVAAAAVKQQVITTKKDFVLLTGQIYDDDTIPQNTEGAELMTVAITPNNSSNILVIEGIMNCGYTANASSASPKILALFQDSTANALASVMWEDTNNANANGRYQLTFRHRMAAGTTSSTTFKIRAGSAASPYEMACNSRERGGGNYDLGGSQFMTHIMVTEYSL